MRIGQLVVLTSKENSSRVADAQSKRHFEAAEDKLWVAQNSDCENSDCENSDCEKDISRLLRKSCG